MKTIAVLTDCSTDSAHATRVAFHMARKMKANLLLFSFCGNVIPTPINVAAQDSEPEPESRLAIFGRSMAREHAGRSFPGAYQPKVSLDEQNTDIVDIMTALLDREDICMIVTGTAGTADPVPFLLGDMCKRIIDWAAVPVMVVPPTAQLRNFEKIAFATHLHEEDINSIRHLGHLMDSYVAELMIAHLNCDPLNAAVRQAEEALNRDLYKKLNCGGVYFRSIPDTSTVKDWAWLSANKKTDLLVVVQTPHEQFGRFFKRGQNESVSYHLNLPVMVMPKLP
ncbi:universal stress protein [Mucilaginibacter sp. AK015]|uniref:universal stress protein n=1 Tax=Mucilaginibacter sp. AK015 TaxID=2723072 RepID=UPI001608A845|nr:universal stress protein [Mucilaginibacter sp. AK015]MBB5396901.1 nucleotide-binding universal stress UspA family protein [Mucilaginibacter sp. AK015]